MGLPAGARLRLPHFDGFVPLVRQRVGRFVGLYMLLNTLVGEGKLDYLDTFLDFASTN